MSFKFTVRNILVLVLGLSLWTLVSYAASWNLTGSMGSSRIDFSTALLGDGKVLVCGGAPYNSYPVSGCELYNPTTGTWSSTGSMNDARKSFRMVRLQDGRVLALGGIATGGGTLSTAEIYNPNSGQWSTTSAMGSARHSFGAVLLQDGHVLVAGGNAGIALLSGCELFNPSFLELVCNGRSQRRTIRLRSSAPG